MDSYTRSVQAWLDKRYQLFDLSGRTVGHQWDLTATYHAHQPIYGPFAGHCEPNFVTRYAVTYQILRTLSDLSFTTLLDVGGGEGFNAFVIRQLLNKETTTTDLSESACRRARTLFHVPARPSDIHDLCFEDESFDVVLCSETLEHVSEPNTAVLELIRLARKAVVITLPFEEESRKIHGGRRSHDHIHSFNLASFDFLEEDRLRVSKRKIISDSLQRFSRIMDAFSPARYAALEQPDALPALVCRMLEVDDLTCSEANVHHGLLFVILKPRAQSAPPETALSPEDLFECRVPYHRLTPPYGPAGSNKTDVSEVPFHLDSTLDRGRFLSIAGWAFAKNLDPDFQRTSLLLHSEENSFLESCAKLERPDVSEHFNCPPMAASGFSVEIDKQSLDPGCYRVSLLIHDMVHSLIVDTPCSVDVD